MLKKDNRKLFRIRLNNEEYNALCEAKITENLLIRDSEAIKLFLLRCIKRRTYAKN